MQLARRQRGFSLVELAIVMLIVGLLMSGALITFSTQVEQRNASDAAQRLNSAVDAIVGFALVNRRLPCPAVSGATGVEAFSAGSALTGGTCSTQFAGYLPALDLGIQPTDSSGYATDPWGGRIRYAVASAITLCSGTSTLPHFTYTVNLKANGISCKPNDIDVCVTSTGINATSCNTATRAASANTVVFLVFSTGKNGAYTSQYGNDENANTNGDQVFVTRLPTESASTQGQFDDYMVMMPAGVFYSKLVTAGILP
jgi:prepilin-type N-terminal cleavage/methylation domain-containing protein